MELLEEVSDPKTIYYGCLLNVQGDAQRLIEDMKELHEENSDCEDTEEDSDSESEEEEEEEEEVKENNEWYPSIDKIIKSLKEFYGIEEDQNTLLRELKSLRIGKNEKVKEFNITYRTLYTKLDKRRKFIGVLDYTDTLKGNYEAWRRISLKDDSITLEKAYLFISGKS
ncbi:hypothetical protein BCR32DRAFT_248981 [Anaeromyces robustus]|uniref:Retrotransposon gag domain-containing protein n=1 Tax=Anaeromyces robustus TaxID=1754192 RepID=A0A1Y1WRG1_9FUNG|nr:hypothetical protein BCR32DRAFT_248981 [Anaeromyces robustus]|eukprot:ORX76131.1 hypothetical protein BCR32DRAFT_248981 [Anaeromyces robustus]